MHSPQSPCLPYNPAPVLTPTHVYIHLRVFTFRVLTVPPFVRASVPCFCPTGSHLSAPPGLHKVFRHRSCMPPKVKFTARTAEPEWNGSPAEDIRETIGEFKAVRRRTLVRFSSAHPVTAVEHNMKEDQSDVDGYFMGTVRSPTAFGINGKVNIVGNLAATGSFTAEKNSWSHGTFTMTPTPTLPDVPDLYYTGSLNPVINTGKGAKYNNVLDLLGPLHWIQN
ncbi:hypothetical protein DFH09DRAFT_1099404 [Mycena vulgaris]|nr:hypothetical protein DFH09DRAFT_1099404 [Mycena vulgaris]